MRQVGAYGAATWGRWVQEGLVNSAYVAATWGIYPWGSYTGQMAAYGAGGCL